MVYKWYILPIGGLYATYHLLGNQKHPAPKGCQKLTEIFVGSWNRPMQVLQAKGLDRVVLMKVAPMCLWKQASLNCTFKVKTWGKPPAFFPQKKQARWWQLKDFLFSPQPLGKMNPFLTSIFFQVGWFNHQPAGDG